MASLMVSGMPVAVPLAPPMLDRMSWRTTPLNVRTSGPFEPSPGNGPVVSSGIVVQSAAGLVAAFALLVTTGVPSGAEADAAALAAAVVAAVAAADADAPAVPPTPPA